MDLLEFAAGSEWPLVSAMALGIFHRPIGRLIDRLKLTKFSGWGVNAEFEKDLARVDELAGAENFTLLSAPISAAAAAHQPTPTPGSRATPGADMDGGRAAPMAISPESSILRSWAELSGRAKTLLQALPGPRAPKSEFSDQWPERLASELGLNQDDIEAIRELRRLRNKVAHANIGPLNQEDAERFHSLTVGLMDKISRKWPGYSDGSANAL